VKWRRARVICVLGAGGTSKHPKVFGGGGGVAATQQRVSWKEESLRTEERPVLRRSK